MASYTADMTAYMSLYIPDSTVEKLEDLPKQSKLQPLIKYGTNAYTLFEVNEVLADCLLNDCLLLMHLI